MTGQQRLVTKNLTGIPRDTREVDAARPRAARDGAPKSRDAALAVRRGVTGRMRLGFESLGVRNYRLYWSGQVVSLIGTWMQQVSLPWLVLALGGTPFQLGLVAAFQFLPAGLLAPFGGVLVDRVDKRLAMIATQVAAMVQATALFVLTVTGTIQIPMVMVLAFGLGVINAIDMPLRQSMAADLVPRRTLANAIALNAMAFNAARVAGPALAGVIIAAGASALGSSIAGVAVNLGLNAVTYLAVLVALLRMDPHAIRRNAHHSRGQPVLASLREGIAHAVTRPIVAWSLFLLGGVAAFGFNFTILLPLFAQDVLHLGADGYGMLFATMGLGALAGTLHLAFMRERPALRLMLGGGLLFGLFEIGVGISREVWLTAPFVLASGYFSMLMLNTVNATVQANVSDGVRGRVMALYVTVFAGSAPIGGLFAGGVAEAFGAPFAFVAGALISLLVIAITAWRLRVAAEQGRLGVTRIDATSMGRDAEAPGVAVGETSLRSAPRR
jgi:MFS family permease